MTGKGKGNKQGKKQSVDLVDAPKSDDNSHVAQIIRGVMLKGYSRQVAEDTFNTMWSNGMDCEYVQSAINLVVEHLKNRNTENPATKEMAEEQIQTGDLGKKLTKVVSFPNMTDILEGLIRWFNTATEQDRSTLMNGSYLGDLYKKVLTQKTLPFSPSLLDSFFKTIFLLPSEVSKHVAVALIAMHDQMVNLPLSIDEAVTLFEDVVRGVASGMSSDNGSMLRLANLNNLLEEMCIAMTAVEGDEPKSQFMRRDLRFKSVKLMYETSSLASSLAASHELIAASETSTSTVDITQRLPIPKNAEQAKYDAVELQKQVDQMRQECNEASGPAQKEACCLEGTVKELTSCRDALRKELESVEAQLTSKTQQLDVAKGRVQQSESHYQRQLESLESRLETVLTVATTATACETLSQALCAAQTKSIEVLKSLNRASKSVDEDTILKATKEYLDSELTCVTFLQNRVLLNTKKADELSNELQRHVGTDDRMPTVAKLRLLISNDREAANALRRFATEIEKNCAEWTTEAIVTKHTEIVTAIYILFAKLQVTPTLNETVYDSIRTIVEAARPKVVAKVVQQVVTTPTKKVIEKKESQPVKLTAKKWNVIKPAEVKSVDEIRKEMEKKSGV